VPGLVSGWRRRVSLKRLTGESFEIGCACIDANSKILGLGQGVAQRVVDQGLQQTNRKVIYAVETFIFQCIECGALARP